MYLLTVPSTNTIPLCLMQSFLQFKTLALDRVVRLKPVTLGNSGSAKSWILSLNASTASMTFLARSSIQPQGFPRFNMPLELGLDLGCRRYGRRHHQGKVCLILNRTTRHWYTLLGATAQLVILSEAKNLAAETLRDAQGDAIGVPILCWSVLGCCTLDRGTRALEVEDDLVT